MEFAISTGSVLAAERFLGVDAVQVVAAGHGDGSSAPFCLSAGKLLTERLEPGPAVCDRPVDEQLGAELNRELTIRPRLLDVGIFEVGGWADEAREAQTGSHLSQAKMTKPAEACRYLQYWSCRKRP